MARPDIIEGLRLMFQSNTVAICIFFTASKQMFGLYTFRDRKHEVSYVAVGAVLGFIRFFLAKKKGED